LTRIAEVSAAVRTRAESGADPDRLEAALWRVLRAETSCNLYWGEAWVDRCHADLDQARHLLDC
jgi:hypothetical protein